MLSQDSTAACTGKPDPLRGTQRAPAGGSAAPGLVNTQQSAREQRFTLENTLEARSQRRAARCARRTITRARLLDQSVQKGGFRGRWLMITFTYRDGTPWAPDQMAKFWHRTRQ